MQAPRLSCLKLERLLSRSELDAYQPGLADRPHGIVANKIDAEHSKENFQDFANQVCRKFSKDVPIFPVSGKLGQNMSPLLHFMRKMYDQKYNQDC